MTADDLERLRHMLAAAREAISFIEGKSAKDLIHNRLLLLAVVKEIEIVGEAASRISPEGRQAAPVIPLGQGYGDEEPLDAWIFQLGPGGNLVDAGNQSSCAGFGAGRGHETRRQRVMAGSG